MTAKDREIEVKFAADPAGLKAAWESPLLGGRREAQAGQTIRSIYYDTPQSDLMRQGMTLRLRRIGRAAPLLAFKWIAPSAEGPFTRGEIEVRHPGAEIDLGLLGEVVAAELRRTADGQPLEPQYQTDVKRRVRRFEAGGARVEAAFDEGEIVAGDRRAPLREVELELIAGEAADFYELAARAAAELPLRLETSSKAKRGYLLRAGARPEPVKAGEPQFPADASFDDAAAIVIGDTLQHFLANWPALREGDHPEAIHQMRVALRRMRALLALLHREAPCAEFTSFRAEAKRIANALGPARECDAFSELMESGPQAEFGRREAFVSLEASIAARRELLHEQARELIGEPEAALFVLRLHAFVARRGWRNGLAAEELPRLTASARAFAEASLDRLRRRALKRGRGLKDLPDEARHELRIALKNLRYAAEAFGGLFASPQEIRAFLRPVSKLQDLLGAHNDTAGARTFLDAIGAPERLDTAFAAGVTLGWFAGGARIAESELVHGWKAFKTATPFWE